MSEPEQFKIGDRVTITTGIMINCGDGTVTAICPHGELLVTLDGISHAYPGRTVRTRVERCQKLGCRC